MGTQSDQWILYIATIPLSLPRMNDVPLQPAFRGFLKASSTVGEAQLGRGEGVGWQEQINISTFFDGLIGNWNEKQFDVF